MRLGAATSCKNQGCSLYFFLLFFGDFVTLGLIALWKCQRFKDGPRDKSNIVLSLLFTQFSVNIHNFHCRNSNVFDEQGVLPQTRWTCYVISVTRISFVFFFFDATVPSGPGPHYQGFTITLRHITFGKNPLQKWSAIRSDLYLATHNSHNIQTSMPTRNPSRLTP